MYLVVQIIILLHMLLNTKFLMNFPIFGCTTCVKPCSFILKLTRNEVFNVLVICFLLCIWVSSKRKCVHVDHLPMRVCFQKCMTASNRLSCLL